MNFSVEPFERHPSDRLGKILIDSHLISNAKLEVALYEQQLFGLRLGEILATHGWVSPQTVDFFADQWAVVTQQDIRYPLGQYIEAAGLITPDQLRNILHNQQLNGHRFGHNAVLMGLMKPETLEYFLTNLFPQAMGYKPTYLSMKETIKMRRYRYPRPFNAPLIEYMASTPLKLELPDTH